MDFGVYGKVGRVVVVFGARFVRISYDVGCLSLSCVILYLSFALLVSKISPSTRDRGHKGLISFYLLLFSSKTQILVMIIKHLGVAKFWVSSQ